MLYGRAKRRLHRLDDGREPQHARAPRRSTRSTTWRCSPATSAAPARRRSRSPASATRWARAKRASPRRCPATASSRARPIARNWPRCGTCRWNAIPDRARPGLSRHHRGGASTKQIRALWIIATNPIVSFPNLGVLQAGAREPRVPRGAGRVSSDADHASSPTWCCRRRSGARRKAPTRTPSGA